MEKLIQDGRDLAQAVSELEFKSRPFVLKTYEPKSIRSLDQNRLMWMWAQEAADQRQDMTAVEVQNEWKLRFGIPILVRDDERMAAAWAAVEAKLMHEEQLELMYGISVTGIMNTKQFTEFLDEVQRYNLEHGIKLTEPMR
jgi:hypothetical protein